MIIARDELLLALLPLSGLTWLCLQSGSDEDHPLILKFVAWSDIAESSEKARVPSTIRGVLNVAASGSAEAVAESSRIFQRPITLRAERLLKVLKSLPEGRRLFLEIDGNQLFIRFDESSTGADDGEGANQEGSGDLRVVLLLEDVPDAEMRFENFPEVMAKFRYRGYAGILAEAFSRIKPAVAKSTTDPRYMLAGVNCRIKADGALQIRASDGHCAALQTLAPLAEGANFGGGSNYDDQDLSDDQVFPEALLPVDPLLKALKSFNPSEPVTFDISGLVPLLVGNIYQITLPRLCGVFVNLEQMVPETLPLRIQLEKRALLTALEQARAAVDDKELETRIEFEIDGDAESVEIMAKGGGGQFQTTLGVWVKELKVSDYPVVRVAFGASLLATLIKSLPNDEIQLATDNIAGPWLLSGEGEKQSDESGAKGLRLIIMPLFSERDDQVPAGPGESEAEEPTPEAANAD